MTPKQISIQDYNYHLPDDKIALVPLPKRDASKLLVYKKGQIEESIYKNIDNYLPTNSLLIFNNTKVINARLFFTKPTGGAIEIFLLEPYKTDYTIALSAKKTCNWKCFIGGANKWKDGSSLKLEVDSLLLEVHLIEKLTDAYVVKFTWNEHNTFAQVIELVGNLPLPPYIKRKADNEDSNRYQTVYAQHNGSVAAPTAGLHFTPTIFENLHQKNIKTNYVTLHVGAGTFKPVKATTMQQHEMHAEWIDISQKTIETILANLKNTIVAVGTTSLRTIESIYWLGVKAYLYPNEKQLTLLQWDVYEEPLCNTNITVQTALVALLSWMKAHKHTSFITSTQILICPGYNYKIVNALVTNFHQPQSTLLLLVAAAVGKQWLTIYNYALQNNFRFLSYGDGSLIWIK